MRSARTWMLSAGVLLLLVALVVLIIQLRSSAASASVAPASATASAYVAGSAPSAAPNLEVAVAAEPAPGQPEKLDPQSDAFFYRFDEVVPANLTRAAASCYEGAPRVHRNKKMKLAFKTRIKNGVVTLEDVKVVVSTLGNAALESCFLREVSRTTWTDPELPDWEQEDILVLRPERGMKKFSKANLEYEGEGPIGKAVMVPGQERPWSDSAERPVD
jgi:hypothetical protein